ncbi:MAG: hypothetical protein WD431_18105 [Cyclobacteriaceae bacterium]
MNILNVGEFTALKDEFGHFFLRQGHYTPGEIDGRWTAEIKNEFLNWLDESPSKIKMTRKQLDDFFKERTW